MIARRNFVCSTQQERTVHVSITKYQITTVYTMRSRHQGANSSLLGGNKSSDIARPLAARVLCDDRHFYASKSIQNFKRHIKQTLGLDTAKKYSYTHPNPECRLRTLLLANRVECHTASVPEQ
eukprot:868430-Pleurochrysis_carterae.AAC.3